MYTYRLSLVVFGGFSILGTIGQAQVVTDGTTGDAQALEGPDYDIGAELGTQAGSNLFHSFDQFSIGTGESATFSGPGSIDNIISRVTGGEISAIDGLIASTIPGASLWLFNPSGVVFGPNASLDVSGSFHVSTADELRTADGTSFSAVDPNASGFSIAEPESFGFLGADPAGITIEGSQIEIAEGDLSIVGGDIEITGGAGLAVAGSTLNVAAASGVTEANVITGELTGAVDGEIAVDGASILASVGDGGGRVRIEGGAFVVDEASSIVSLNDGSADGDIGISIEAETADITSQSGLLTFAQGDGRGGDISIVGDDVTFENGGVAQSFAEAGGDGGAINIASSDLTVAGTTIASDTAGTARGGNINVSSETVVLEDGGLAITTTRGAGEGGTIAIAADELTLTDGDIATSAIEGSTGDGGDIVIAAGSTEIRPGGPEPERGSFIGTATFGPGDAGDVDIQGDALRLDGDNQINGAAVQTVSDSTGSGGRIRLNIDGRLDLVRGGIVNADATGSTDDTANIEVTAEGIVIDGDNNFGETITGITLDLSGGDAAAGAIVIRAEDLVVRDGAVINSITDDASDAGDIIITVGELSLLGGDGTASLANITSATIPGSTGDAGRIAIVADNINMDGNSEISTSTIGDGDAGDIDIDVKYALEMRGQADISSDSEVSSAGESGLGNAGTIVINASNLLVVDDALIASVTGGSGNGGSIDIEADTALLDSGNDNEFSGITTQAAQGSSGDAGNITLSIDDLTLLNDAQISSASFSEGNAGTVSLQSEQIIIDNRLSETDALTGIVTSVAGVTDGEGDAGSILIAADDLTLLGDGAEITSSNDGVGAAGTVDIQLTGGLLLDSGADIVTDSASGGGGGISIRADEFIAATGPSATISTTVADDTGNAGDILIETPLLALGDSNILAQADAGQGGDIQVTVDDLILSQDAVINAEAGATGVDGTVLVSSPEVDLTGGLVALDGQLLNVRALLRERCAARQVEDSSSFTLGTGGSIPADLDAPRLSLRQVPIKEAALVGQGQRTVLVLPCPKAAS